MADSTPEQETVLALLESAGDKVLSVSDIATAIGSDIHGAMATLRSLRRYGYLLQRGNELGYRLARESAILHPWEVRKQLQTSYVGRRMFEHYLKTESTQKVAIALGESENKDVHGSVIVAEQQSAGRGRAARKWISPTGGVWMSVVFKPEISPENCTLLPFVGALATLSAIREYPPLEPWLKWPNDVLIGRKKIAGILGDMALEENKVRWAVLGIGINANVNAAALGAMREKTRPNSITSLREELHQEIDRSRLIANVLNALESYYNLLARDDGAAKIMRLWKGNSRMLGRIVTVTRDGSAFKGKAVDVLDDGRLVVQRGRARRIFSSGEIKVLLGRLA